MKKSILKLTAITLCLVMLTLLAGCKSKETDVEKTSSAASSAPVSSEPETEFTINPLTGVENLDPSAENKRPVAVMINNLNPIAQRVQTGLDKADIVYEAYAEGGVTRLLAIFKDISKVGTVGTIRSARYSYIDLAMGHDAIYVHAGINDSHATPHVNETGIDNINLLKGTFNGMSFRESNGEALEHTLYSSGEKISKGLEKVKWRTELNYNTENWQSFVTDDAEVTPTEGKCDAVSVKMSSAYVSKFEFDATTNTYKKFSGSNPHKDYKSGKQLEFKNVLVLKTPVTNLSSDGYIVKTGLDGGEGYYITNGGYQNIKWSKGSAKNPIKITLANGNECAYNPGNTWVCMMDNKNSVEFTDNSATETASK